MMSRNVRLSALRFVLAASAAPGVAGVAQEMALRRGRRYRLSTSTAIVIRPGIGAPDATDLQVYAGEALYFTADTDSARIAALSTAAGGTYAWLQEEPHDG